MDDNSEETQQASPDLSSLEIDETLKDYDKEDLVVFIKDLYLVFDIIDRIDQTYDENSNITQKNINKFNKLIEDWNEKYREVILKLNTADIECKMDIFLREQEKEIISLVTQMNWFVGIRVSKDRTIIEATFELENHKKNTITLEAYRDMYKLIYLKEDMLDPKSPEFRLCTYFGLFNGYNKSKDLRKYLGDFSFDIGKEASKMKGDGWQRMYPQMGFGSGRGEQP